LQRSDLAVQTVSSPDGSGQQDWLQKKKKTDSFRYRFSFWYYRLFF